MRKKDENFNKRVLIVEDEGIVANDLKNNLKKIGFKFIDIVYTGEEAIEFAQKIRPDLVLMDVRLKGKIDGIKAASKIKEIGIPVIYVTAYGDKKTIERAKKTEPFGYIYKPFTEIELRSAIEIAFYRYKIESELRRSESKFRILCKNLPIGYLSLDKEGIIVDANNALLKILGYSKKDVIGKSFYKFLAKDYKDKFANRFKRCAQSNKACNAEYNLINKDGNIVTVELNCKAFYDDKNFKFLYCAVRDITKYKKFEEEIFKQNEFLKHIIDSIGYPFYVINVDDYSIVLANSAALQGEKTKKLKCYKLGHNRNTPCNSKEHKCPINEIKTTKKPVMLEHIHYNKKGEKRFIEVYAYPLFDKKGNVKQIIEYNLDVTERKKIQNKLQESEERFRAVFENALDAIYIKDLNLKYTHVNTMAEKFLGSPSSQLIGKTDFDILPKNEAELNKQIDLRVLGGEIIKEESAKLVGNDLLYFHIVKVPIRSKDGRVIGLCGFAHDISELKQAEEAIREERDRAQKYLDIAGTIIIVVNYDQKILLINKKGCEILGYREDEIVGKNWFDFCVPERKREEARRVFKKLISGKIRHFEYYECPVLTKDEKERIIAWHNTVVKDDDGKIVGTLSSGEDITDRKKAERELKKRNKELEKFNRLMVGRELKMIELKKKIKKLEEKIGVLGENS